MINRYTVGENENVDDIARKFGVSTIDIVKANNLNSYYLKPGTVLIIPEQSDSVFLDYVVKKGDSLYSIAENFNTNPVILSEINGLKLYDYIYPNQVIIVPKENTKLYITKEGDTINSLIDSGTLSLEDLQRYNKNLYLIPEQLIISVDRK